MLPALGPCISNPCHVWELPSNLYCANPQCESQTRRRCIGVVRRCEREKRIFTPQHVRGDPFGVDLVAPRMIQGSTVMLWQAGAGLLMLLWSASGSYSPHLCVRVWVCVCVRLCVSLSLCVCLSVCVSVSVCVCARARAHVCLQVSFCMLFVGSPIPMYSSLKQEGC